MTYYLLRGVCEWFLFCENEATSEQSHPILGRVPICDRCQKRLRKEDEDATRR